MKNTTAAAPDDNWRVESDLRTLCEAREIQADPKRMAKVKSLAREKMKNMEKIAG